MLLYVLLHQTIKTIGIYFINNVDTVPRMSYIILVFKSLSPMKINRKKNNNIMRKAYKSQKGALLIRDLTMVNVTMVYQPLTH